MFHPVGSQPPSVYWRRRLLAVGSLVIVIVLIVVTISALSSSGSGSPSAGASNSQVPAGDTSSSASKPGATTHTAPRSTAPRSTGTTTRSGSSGSSSSSAVDSATVSKCTSSELKIAAVVGKSTYRVGQDPMVGLRVTDVGSTPCAADLADKQIVLKVYNGVSRVWGSHDCQVQPGKKERTLGVNAPVLASVSWSGETSQPKCAGTRQHVGAGTYTLYATLSGTTGTAARFTIG